MIGDSGSGKSSMLEAYISGKFKNTISTVGLDYKMKTMKVNDQSYKIQIWDTAGQEKFNSITKSYYSKCQGIVIVYDITTKASFVNVQKWLSQIILQTNNDIVKILVGNKNDLTSSREVTYEEGENLASSLKMQFFETSAKNNFNIKEVYDSVIYKIINNGIVTTDEKRASGFLRPQSGIKKPNTVKITPVPINTNPRKCCK
jgi:Ras-related protein Rab-1A